MIRKSLLARSTSDGLFALSVAGTSGHFFAVLMMEAIDRGYFFQDNERLPRQTRRPASPNQPYHQHEQQRNAQRRNDGRINQHLADYPHARRGKERRLGK